MQKIFLTVYAICVYLKNIKAFDAVAKLPVPPTKLTSEHTGWHLLHTIHGELLDNQYDV